MVLAEVKAVVEFYWMWSGILVELDHVKTVQHRHQDNINAGHARPGFSYMYDNVYNPRTKTVDCSLKQGPDRPDPVDQHTKHRLWWCLGQLLGDANFDGRFPYAMLFTVPDRHLQSSDKTERSRLDEILFEIHGLRNDARSPGVRKAISALVFQSNCNRVRGK